MSVCMPPTVAQLPPHVNTLCPLQGTTHVTVRNMEEKRRRQFAARLRSFRQARGLTMRELAAQSYISYSYIRSLEAGIKNPPSTDVLEQLGHVLRVSVDQLLGNDPPDEESLRLDRAVELLEDMRRLGPHGRFFRDHEHELSPEDDAIIQRIRRKYEYGST